MNIRIEILVVFLEDIPDGVDEKDTAIVLVLKFERSGKSKSEARKLSASGPVGRTPPAINLSGSVPTRVSSSFGLDGWRSVR
jgi:hypothetical protein